MSRIATTEKAAQKPARVKKKARSVGRPRGKNRDARLAKILAVARKHFAENGYEQTTFQDISHDADMTRTALYSYFDSKADLYLATLIDIHEEFLPDFLSTLEECKTLRERFRRMALASTAANARDSNITGFLSALPIEIRRHPELNAVVRKYNHQVYKVVAGMFEEAKRNGEIASDVSTGHLVSAFIGGAIGVGLFQYGMQGFSQPIPSMSKAMSVFVSMSEGKIFSAR